tara:strand:+ start:12 stop:242 length:231 start_codon:yes stop_codon:yes gene_type:complete
MTKINIILAIPFIYLIKLYRLFISPMIGSNCRYSPTCSEYGLKALKKYGLFKGLYLTTKRILKCNSLFKGGYDPVP